MKNQMYEVEIKTTSRIFNVRGKPIRSPFKAIVDLSEAKRIENEVKSLGLSDYSIREVSSVSSADVSTFNVKNIDNLLKEEKLSKENEVINKPIDVVISEIKEMAKTSTTKKKEINNIKIEELTNIRKRMSKK